MDSLEQVILRWLQVNGHRHSRFIADRVAEMGHPRDKVSDELSSLVARGLVVHTRDNHYGLPLPTTATQAVNLWRKPIQLLHADDGTMWMNDGNGGENVWQSIPGIPQVNV